MNINARQIDSLDFNYLNQAESYQYSVDQLSRVKGSTAIMSKLQVEVNDWESATQAFDSAYRKATTAGQTKVVQDVDDERDDIYTGFTGTVNNALKSPVAAQRQAAEQLQEPIKRYGVSASAEYQEQTMRTGQLCNDLLANYSSQLAVLGLTEWVEALQAKNEEFKAAMIQRTNEQAGYVKSELSNLRLQMISKYRVFVKLMNVVLIYEGDTAYATVIDQLNAEVRHYNQIISRKKPGGSGGSSDGGDTPTPTPTPTPDGGGDDGGDTPTPTPDPEPTPDPTPDPDPNPSGGGNGGTDDGTDES